MCHALTQGIRKKLKLSLSTKKIKEAVSNVEITVIKQKQLNRRTQHQLPLFCQNFQIFCCKIETVKENQLLSDFSLLGVTKHHTGVKIYEK